MAGKNGGNLIGVSVRVDAAEKQTLCAFIKGWRRKIIRWIGKKLHYPHKDDVPPDSHCEWGAELAYAPKPFETEICIKRNEPISERELYGIYREYMIHEDNLIGARLNGYLTVSGLLFAASTAIFVGMVQIVRARSKVRLPRTPAWA